MIIGGGEGGEGGVGRGREGNEGVGKTRFGREEKWILEFSTTFTGKTSIG